MPGDDERTRLDGWGHGRLRSERATNEVDSGRRRAWRCHFATPTPAPVGERGGGGGFDCCNFERLKVVRRLRPRTGLRWTPWTCSRKMSPVRGKGRGCLWSSSPSQTSQGMGENAAAVRRRGLAHSRRRLTAPRRQFLLHSLPTLPCWLSSRALRSASCLTVVCVLVLDGLCHPLPLQSSPGLDASAPRPFSPLAP